MIPLRRSDLERPHGPAPRQALTCGRVWLGLVVGLLLSCAAPRAHHAFDTEFDRRMPLSLQGIVTRIEWINPHAWLHLGVKDADGRVVVWRIQTASPGVLSTLGWRKDSLAPGTFVVIDGFRARTRESLLHGHDVTLADGTRLCANIPCRCCRPFEPMTVPSAP